MTIEERAQDPFAVFNSPWWQDMNRKLCADGWPTVVVALNCMVRDAKQAYETERELRLTLANDSDYHLKLYQAERERSQKLIEALKACQVDSLFYAEEICFEGSQGRKEAWSRIEKANRAIAEYEASHDE